MLLQLQSGGVIDGAELEDGDQVFVATDLRGFTRIKTNILTTEDTEYTEELHRSFAQNARSG